MNKKSILLLLVVLTLCSCYPMGTFQGPEILPEGKESIGIGLSWMTNIISLQDTSTGTEDAFFADGSLLFRRGLGYHSEIGMKFSKSPYNSLAFMADAKWQVISSPLQVALDLGLAYWKFGAYGWVGYHPALMFGTEKLFAVLQYNYIRSPANVKTTQDILVGRHIKQQHSPYTLTPFLGIHRNTEVPDNIYYSLGLGYRQPLDKWTFPGN